MILTKKSFLTDVKDSYSSSYEQNIIGQIQSDSIGEAIRKDQLIVRLGYEEFKFLGDTLRPNQLYLRVRSYLRTLASLIINTKEAAYEQRGRTFETEDFFIRDNMTFIEAAIEKLNSATDSVNKKKQYGVTLKKSIAAIRSLYLSHKQDDKALEVGNLEACLRARWKFLFRSSEIAAQRRRMDYSRRPVNLPDVKELEKVRDHMESKLSQYLHCKNISPNQFVEVRRIVVNRLMMFNSRRANEISSMTIKDVNEAISNAWLAKNDISDEYFIGYIQGKNPLKPVSVLIPTELRSLLEYLTNTKIRKMHLFSTTTRTLFLAQTRRDVYRDTTSSEHYARV